MKRNQVAAVLGCAAALALAGCGGAGAQSEPSFESSAPITASDQVVLGQQLYGKYCASCHGAQGQGDKAPALVGASALPLQPPPGAKSRTGAFKTAADVFHFVKTTMPGNAPGSLTDEQYAAILAFALKANGIAPSKPLDPQGAAEIVLHP
jgi:mono/diheme cytochrome c family protein